MIPVVGGTVAVSDFAGEKEYGAQVSGGISHSYPSKGIRKILPGGEAIQNVLNRMGKTSPDKELNCGCCGYPTCREMAAALCQGKAQLDMCLPYLRERAERHSREIVGNTLAAADEVIEKQMRVAQNIASILGETTAETKVMVVKLKQAIQGNE
jgi:uncharacterized Fe-S cluster-containing protein